MKEKLKALLANKWSWILVAFLLGGDVGWQAHRWWAEKSLPVRFQMHGGFGAGPGDEGDGAEDDTIADPFEEMRQMQEKMLRQFAGRGASGGGQIVEMGAADFKEREDDRFVYYDFDFRGMIPQDLKVKVEDGQVSISGRLEKQTDEGGAAAIISSSFQRAFPVPPNVIAEKFQMDQDTGKLVLKFPKRAP